MRLVSEHFKQDGSPKRAYETRAEAKRAVGKEPQRVYRCKFCGAWHRATDHEEVKRRADAKRQREENARQSRRGRRRRRKADALASQGERA